MAENSKRIAVTGAHGKVGRTLVPYLKDKGYEVFGIDCEGRRPRLGRRGATRGSDGSSEDGRGTDAPLPAPRRAVQALIPRTLSLYPFRYSVSGGI